VPLQISTLFIVVLYRIEPMLVGEQGTGTASLPILILPPNIALLVTLSAPTVKLPTLVCASEEVLIGLETPGTGLGGATVGGIHAYATPTKSTVNNNTTNVLSDVLMKFINLIQVTNK
jgi:hypothetical protein